MSRRLPPFKRDIYSNCHVIFSFQWSSIGSLILKYYGINMIVSTDKHNFYGINMIIIAVQRLDLWKKRKLEDSLEKFPNFIFFSSFGGNKLDGERKTCSSMQKNN